MYKDSQQEGGRGGGREGGYKIDYRMFKTRKCKVPNYSLECYYEPF
jgi:hypothetical protein